MAAGSAVPSVIAGTVTASLTLNLQPYVEALGAEICAQGSNVVSGLTSLTAALSSDLHNQVRMTDASLTHKCLIGERLRTEREYGPHATVATSAPEARRWAWPDPFSEAPRRPPPLPI